MKIVWTAMAVAGCALAGVDGFVVNGTTGKPQPGVIVTMVQPSETGMQTMGTVRSDAQGMYKFDKQPGPGPVLLQSIYQGVMYTRMLQPGAPTTAVGVQVFDTTTDAAAGKVAQDMILIEPGPGGMNVTETMLCDNQTKQTYSNKQKGSVEFYVPEAAKGGIQVTVSSTSGVPIQEAAEKTKTKGIYKVDFALKPGQTRFDIAYTLPAGDTFRGERVDMETPLRLVVPSTVTLSGEGIDALGQEPQTQAKIYDVKTRSYKASIDGTGSLRAAADDTGQQQQGEDDGRPQIESSTARIYSQVYWILGLTFGILALGGVMLYRKGAA